MFNVKPYNTCSSQSTVLGCYGGGINVLDSKTVIFNGGPANIMVTLPDTMSVKIGLVWKNSIGMDEAYLIDSDESNLLTLNEEYITVPIKG